MTSYDELVSQVEPFALAELRAFLGEEEFQKQLGFSITVGYGFDTFKNYLYGYYMQGFRLGSKLREQCIQIALLEAEEDINEGWDDKPLEDNDFYDTLLKMRDEKALATQ